MTVIYSPSVALSSVTPVVGSTGTFSGQLIGGGTTTNDNAAAGQIGEYLEAELLAGSAVNVPTATVVDITTLSLTAGDWNVWGTITFVPAVGTLPTTLNGWINNAATTTPTRPGKGAQFQSTLSFTSGSVQQMPVGQRRFSFSTTTTIYLGCSAAFTASTLAAHGIICARRAR